MQQAMIQDALLRLMGGAELMPFEQEMLSQMPLPDCVLTPFLGQETDMKESLRVTAKAVDTWGEEARKANYFTKHYITLSRMILNGVTVLGRGLATLHANGEDLSLAPKSIDELIKIASWHLRLSYIGVMQTVKSYPDVSTRLLNNQLSWASLIFRLFKTKEKLARPVKQPALNSPKQPVLEGKQKPALADLKPVDATPSFGPARSLAPMAGTVARGASTGKEEPETVVPENEMIETAEEADVNETSYSNEAQEKTENETDGGRSSCSESDRAKPEPCGAGSEPSPEEPSPIEMDPVERAFTPKEPSEPLVKEPPKFIDVLQRAAERSGDPDRLKFTRSELVFLANDPEFYWFDPQTALDMRAHLARAGP